MTRRKHRKIRLRSIYQWHRYIGLTAAVFVIVISLTGLLLNHTGELRLDHTYIHNRWLLNWYGIRAPDNPVGYRAGQHWFSQWRGRLLMQQIDLGDHTGKLLGAVQYNGMFVIALEGMLMLVTPEGELIETLQAYQGVPADMLSIGLTPGKHLAVKTAHGSYIADNDLLVWRHSQTNGVKWSAPGPLPETVQDTMLQPYRGKGLTLERVLLDVHSGRLLGKGGVYFFDFIAISLLLLAISGMWLWLLRLIKARRHP